LTLEQAELIINSSSGTSIQPAIILALTMGFPGNEILGLRWEQDIDLSYNNRDIGA
jgi:hypothetical protein